MKISTLPTYDFCISTQILNLETSMFVMLIGDIVSDPIQHLNLNMHLGSIMRSSFV